MNQTLLNATWRVESMVGRQVELDKIKQSIYTNPDDPSCRLVLVSGPGGIGKSRLLEEVVWRAGNPQARAFAAASIMQPDRKREDWTPLGNATVSDVIDLIDIRLSARTQMVQAMRDALAWPGGVDFSDYDGALRDYLRALENSASFDTIKSRADKVERDFWQAFHEHAEKGRIVLALDTAERLVLRSSAWLIDKDLLQPDELVISSQQWLLKQLQDGRFSNTTLIIAGRDGASEGGPFFEKIKAVWNDAALPYKLLEVTLKPLEEEETTAYFQYLDKEWQERVRTVNGNNSHFGREFARISRTMQTIANDADRLRVLHLITGGWPVLLSLYGDIIHETDYIPEPLQLSSEQARWTLEDRGQNALQDEIERSFIDLLFQQPGLRSEILRALARCPAGLSARQLHFVIDSEPDDDPSVWEPDMIRLKEIKRHLEQIGLLSIARPRPDDPLSLQDAVHRRSLRDETRRMGLQDEIYRIYAERMGETKELRSFEYAERTIQYKKLIQWAGWRLLELRVSLRSYQAEDERRLITAIQLPTMALRPYVPSPSPSEQESRSQIQQAIRDWELEQLHYDLLQNPNHGLNASYGDLAEQQFRANNEEAEFIVQQEMWRVLHDPYALQFTDLSPEKLTKLQRAARDEDPARWIKRFVLRREYARAVELWQEVELAVLDEKEGDRLTWQHPLNSGERLIWKSYAQLMQGGLDITAIVDQMKIEIKLLKRFASAQQTQRVGPHGETGFQDHDALPRLYRIIAAGYNFAGYGRVIVGQYSRGVGNYVRALIFAKETKSEALEAAVRNNLGRALASLGRDERGYRVCADALALRRELGAEIPIAYSLNTLALISNGMQRVPTAWREAAQAAAIFRRVGDNRGLGLALIQLGIGLRRLANSYEPTAILEATPEDLFATAQRAVGEAVDIFSKDPEVLRQVEARLEFACIQRDQMRLESVKSSSSRVARFYRDCMIEFGHVIQLAEERGFKHLALQAQVDFAWAHFFADHIDEAGNAANEVTNGIRETYRGYLIELDNILPDKHDESHVYYQLAKIQGLYAAISMTRFKARREHLRMKIVKQERKAFYEELKKDVEAQSQMASAAEAYVLSLAYGQIYSPRSRSLVITFDQIYDHLKAFNVEEYRMFRTAARGPQEELRRAQGNNTSYQIEGMVYDFSNLDQWLDDCFGPVEVRDDDS